MTSAQVMATPARPALSIFVADKMLATLRARAACRGAELVAIDLHGRFELVLTKGASTRRFARWESSALEAAVAELEAH